MLKRKLLQPDSEEKDPPNSRDKRTQIMDLSLQNCPLEDVSKYFPSSNQNRSSVFADQLLEIQRNLNNRLNQIDFIKPPIRYVYNPTEYAKIPNELYFRKYCQSKKKLLFVGMNPGPFGMCQTGVPFGDTNWIKNWLQIEGPVSKPALECPNRLVLGFDCTRKEQSGDRFWKFWSDLCGTPDIFFKNAFIYNYCPLAFMDKDGRNVTPAEIKESKQLESICDELYLDVVKLMEPEILVAIGKYIEKRTLLVFKTAKLDIPIICMPHPSPRAANNQNWPEKAKAFIDSNKLMPFFQ